MGVPTACLYIQDDRDDAAGRFANHVPAPRIGARLKYGEAHRIVDSRPRISEGERSMG
jgi:hypothetical protein